MIEELYDPSLSRTKIELETIFDALSDPIFLHNNELKIVRVNRAYCEAAGMSYNRIIGQPYYKIFPVMDVPFKMCERHDELHEDEIYIPSLDKTFYVRCFPVRNVKGSSQFCVHIMEDITGQKKAEEKLNAISLDNIRLYKEMTDKSIELEQRVETLKIMHEMDLSTLSVMEESELIETLVQLVSRLIPSDIIIIAKVDNERNGFVYKAGHGLTLSPLSKDSFFPFSDTFASEVILTKRIKFIPDLMLEDEMLPFQTMLIENGYRSGIIAPLIAKGKIIGMFHVGSRQDGVFNSNHFSILEGLSAQIAVSLDNVGLVQAFNEMVVNIIRTLSVIIDAKSPWTAGHSERVTRYALAIAGEMGMDKKDLKDLELAGLLHDIGKVGTYDIILDKPGKLNEEETKIMQQHPEKGVDILAPIKHFQRIVPAIKYHHEFYNGEGYPEGLKGEDIPLMARILAVADTVDAMSADRPYRRGRSMDVIVEELKRCSGSQFDPEVVSSFRLSLISC